MNLSNLIKISAAFLLLTIQYQTWAQENTDSVKVLKPVPVVEIPQFLENTNQLIKEVEKLVELPPEIQKLDTALSKSHDELEIEFELLNDSSTFYTISQLEVSSRYWKEVESEISVYNESLASHFLNLQLIAREIDDAAVIWDTTFYNAKNQSAPSEIISMISEGKKKLNNGKLMLIEAQKRSLKIQAGISPYLTKINEAKELINTRKSDLLNKIWLQDSPLIWNMKRDTTATLTHIHLKDTFIDHWAKLKAFIAAKDHFRISFIIIFFSFLIYVLYIKFQQGHVIENYYQTQDINLVIKHPLFTSILLTLVVTSMLFDITQSVRRFYALAVIIPTAAFIHIKAENYKLQQMLAYILLFVLHQSIFFISGSNFERIHILFLSIIMASGILFIMSKKKYDYELMSFLHIPALKFLLNVYALANLFSIGFNLSGRFEFSKLLVMGSTSSVLIGVIYFLGVNLMASLISIFLIGTPLEKSNIVKSHHKLIIKQCKRTLGFAATIFWLYFTLGNFSIQDIIIENLTILFTSDIEAGKLKMSLADIFAFFITIQISIWLSKLVRFILEQEVFSRRQQQDKRTSQGAVLVIVRYSFITLGVLFAFAAAGIELSSIAVLLGALGVGIGFGLQGIFNNLVSGIILAVERPMQIGDIVEVHDTLGFVKDIGFRASTIKTYDGSEVIVPNGDFISSKVINWTLSDKRSRLIIKIKTKYDERPEKVMEALEGIVKSQEFILKTPAPYIQFKTFGDGYLEFQVRVWISNFDNGVSSGSKLTLALYNGLREKNIEIPYPTQNILISNPENE